MHDNRVYAPAGAAVGEQRKTIAAWQAQGHDLGTAVATLPADAEVIAMARRSWACRDRQVCYREIESSSSDDV